MSEPIRQEQNENETKNENITIGNNTDTNTGGILAANKKEINNENDGSSSPPMKRLKSTETAMKADTMTTTEITTDRTYNKDVDTSSLTPASLPPDSQASDEKNRDHQYSDDNDDEEHDEDDQNDESNNDDDYDDTTSAGSNPSTEGSHSPILPPPAPPSTPASIGPASVISAAAIQHFQEIATPRPGGRNSNNSNYNEQDEVVFPVVPYMDGIMENESALVQQQQKQQQQQQKQKQQQPKQSKQSTAATPQPSQAAAAAAADIATPAPTRKAGNQSTATTTKKSGPGIQEDFSEWAVGDRYEMMRILGRGSYGEVAQARDLWAAKRNASNNNNNDADAEMTTANDFVAIKRITSAFEQEVDAIRLYREIHILRRMRGNECIIQLLDVVQPPSDDLDDFHDLYLVFEYVDTDLYKLIMSPQYLTTEHIQTFLYQMLAGLKFIHSSSVIHRDLKPANILLNEDCSLKICDFGLARIVDSSTMVSSATVGDDDVKGGAAAGLNLPSPPPPGRLTRQLTKHVVTRWYRAPELILIQPYTSAVDIWSLGCIMAELLSMQEGSVPGYQDRVPLFPGGSCYPLSGEGASIRKDERLDQLSVIFGVIGTPVPEDIASIGNANQYIKNLDIEKGKSFESLYPAADPAAIDLLKKMLKFNPNQRCTADEALEHDFFKGVRRKEMEKSAIAPLVGPEFLETARVDLQTLKRKTYEEVLWYRREGSILAPRSEKLN